MKENKSKKKLKLEDAIQYSSAHEPIQKAQPLKMLPKHSPLIRQIVKLLQHNRKNVVINRISNRK